MVWSRQDFIYHMLYLMAIIKFVSKVQQFLYEMLKILKVFKYYFSR